LLTDEGSLDLAVFFDALRDTPEALIPFVSVSPFPRL